jgi:hypothetical protein
MRLAKIVALLGTLIMGGILIYGFTVGDFTSSQRGSYTARSRWSGLPSGSS